MNLELPDFTKLTWQLNIALIGATFSVFALIYNDQYIYYGFLTFLYGIVGVVLMPSIEHHFPVRDKWRNFVLVQGALTFIWVYFVLQLHKSEFITLVAPTGALIPGLSAIATIAAAWAAISSYKLSKNLYVSNLHKAYFDLMIARKVDQEEDDNYFEHWLKTVCDFFEFICFELDKGKIEISDVSMFLPNMQQDEYLCHAKKQNKIDKRIYFNYLSFIESRIDS